MNKSSDDQFRDINQVMEDLDSCPSAEQFSAFLDRQLDGDQALDLEFHINSCAQCVELMSILREAETAPINDPSFLDRQGREKRRVAAKLGLETKEQGRMGIISRFEWLWSVKTPLFVPVGITALILCLFVFRGAPVPGEVEMPVSFLHMGERVHLGQEVERSDAGQDDLLTVRAGEVIPLSIQIDFLEHEAGEVLRCLVLDGQGIELTSSETVIPDNFQTVVPLRFAESGTFTVQIYFSGEDEPFDTCTFKVQPPAPGNSRPY